jgi:putative drug exporter of the RND superfamily
MNDPFVRLSTFVIRWRWPVVAIWAVMLVVASGFLAPKAADVVKGGGFSMPGSESVQAADVLQREFKLSPDNTVVVVYRSPSLTVDQPGYRKDVADSSHRIAGLAHVASVLTFYNSGDGSLVSRDRHVTLGIVSLSGTQSDAQKAVSKLRDQLKGISLQHYATGKPAIDADTFKTSEEDVKRSELVTIPVVLILLLLVFRTVISSLLPLILGACAVFLSQAFIYLIASHLDTSIFSLNVSSMIGLGLGIDFSLMIVSRLRGERAAGRAPREALTIAMATAGRSIAYSATMVVLAMLVLTLVVAQLMIIRSISLAVILVALMALFAGLTLLPAVLAILGDRIEWLPVLPRRKASGASSRGVWYRFSHLVMKRPWLWLMGSLLILIVMAIPAKDLKMAAATPGALPSQTESVKGYNVVKNSFGEGSLAPIEIVVRTTPGGVWTPKFLRALQRFSNRVRSDPRVSQVRSLTTLAQSAGVRPNKVATLRRRQVLANPQFSAAAARVVNLRGASDTALVTVVTKYGQYDDRHQKLVGDLRGSIQNAIPQLASYQVLVGGSTATFLDFQSTLYGRFPFIVFGVMLVIFIILMMFFQSILLPIKAMLLNLASIVATYGALVVIFQHGFGTNLLGFQAQGLMSNITPAVLYVILFGLSSDYEVFLLSRVKEFYAQTGNNEEAVAAGLQNTAGVITAAGLILVGTFGSFASARVVTIKEIGIGLAIGVALDTTVVRIIMVPATMKLMGDWNWWMPVWLKRIVPEIREGPAAGPAETRAETA